MNHEPEKHAHAAHEGPLFHVWEGRINESRAIGGYARVSLTVDASFPVAAAGQFFMVRLPWGPALPRPLAPLDAARGRIEFLLKVDGLLRSTLAAAPRGAVLQMRGPHGVPYAQRVDPGRRYVLVGGGSGVAPLLRFASEHPDRVAAEALGFRSSAVRALLPEVDLASEEEDGETAEMRLRNVWRTGLGIIACGPEPLLAGVARAHRGEPGAYVSLETRLGCGYGACRGCTIKTPDGARRVCVDGPLFACSEVPWLG